MTEGARARLRRLLQVVVVFLAAATPRFPAQTNTPAPALPINRFLLIVETSHAMQRRAEGTLRTVNDLIASRIRGQLRLNDSIGVWTFNETLFTGKLPLQEWSEGERTAIASKIFDFLQEQKYEKQGRLDKLLPALLKVVKNSQFISVILISDGSQEVHGTPFDTQINQLYKQWTEQQQKSRMPFVTVLRAERGQFTNYSVTPAPFPVEMPPLPVELIKPKTLPPAVPVVSAPKPAPPMAPPLIISGRKPGPPPAVVPAPNSSTVIVQTSALSTNAETGARFAQNRPADPNAISSALQEPRPAEPTPAAAAPANLSAAATRTPAANLESTPVKKLSEEPLLARPAPVSNAGETKTGSDVAVANAATSQPDRSPPTPDSQITPKPEMAVASGNPTSSFRLITAVGLASAGLVAIGGLWFWKRRARLAAHVSLITRSLDRDKH